MYLNHRAIVHGPSITEAFGPALPNLGQPTFFWSFSPWQLATIAALAIAAWAAPISLAMLFLG